MILISLMLAATPAPAARPDPIQRRAPVRPVATSRATRSKRLIELEATVRSLRVSHPEPAQGSGPEGL